MTSAAAVSDRGYRGRHRLENVDPAMPQERLAHRQPLGRRERVRLAAAERAALRARRLRREPQQRRAIALQRRGRLADPVPFEHREFRRVQRAALAIAEHPGEREDPRSPAASSFFIANSGEVCR